MGSSARGKATVGRGILGGVITTGGILSPGTASGAGIDGSDPITEGMPCSSVGTGNGEGGMKKLGERPSPET